MKRTHRTAVVIGLAAIAIVTADASAMYNPRTGTFMQRDPGAGAGGPVRIGAGGRAVGGSFVERDPHPTAQYADGMSLYQYVKSTPVNGLDPWGLWKIERVGGPKAIATAGEKRHVSWGYWKNDQISDLADAIGLEPTEFKKWLTLTGGTIKAVAGNKNLTTLTANEGICPGEKVQVPNTVLAYWAGHDWVGIIHGKTWVMWDSDVSTLKKRGFSAPEKSGMTAAQFEQYIRNSTASKKFHGLFFWGHGFDKTAGPPPRSGGVLTDAEKGGNILYYSYFSAWAPAYKPAFGVLFACYTQNTMSVFSSNAVFWGSSGVLSPHGFHLYGPPISSLLKPGDQGTKE